MGLTVNLLVQFCKECLPYLAGPVQVSGVHLSSVPVEPPFVDTRYHQFRWVVAIPMKNIPVIYPTIYPNGNVIGTSTPMKNSSASPGLDAAELQLQRVSVSADLTRGLRPRRRRCTVEMKGRLLHWC